MSLPAPYSALSALARLIARAAAQEWLRDHLDASAAIEALDNCHPRMEREPTDANNAA